MPGDEEEVECVDGHPEQAGLAEDLDHVHFQPGLDLVHRLGHGPAVAGDDGPEAPLDRNREADKRGEDGERYQELVGDDLASDRARRRARENCGRERGRNGGRMGGRAGGRAGGLAGRVS